MPPPVGLVAETCYLQRLGECLGKGAFGSVYKAFNWGTGEAVAIKQIKIADLPRSELRMIEVLLEPKVSTKWANVSSGGN
jgi:serine/threonine protein kinase